MGLALDLGQDVPGILSCWALIWRRCFLLAAQDGWSRRPDADALRPNAATWMGRYRQIFCAVVLKIRGWHTTSIARDARPRRHPCSLDSNAVRVVPGKGQAQAGRHGIRCLITRTHSAQHNLVIFRRTASGAKWPPALGRWPWSRARSVLPYLEHHRLRSPNIEPCSLTSCDQEEVERRVSYWSFGRVALP